MIIRVATESFPYKGNSREVLTGTSLGSKMLNEATASFEEASWPVMLSFNRTAKGLPNSS